MTTIMDTAITEFEEIDPDELHLVGQGANGFKALLAKSASEEVREVLETIADATNTTITKADEASDEHPQCDACDGTGLAKGSDALCGKCRGTKIMPQVGQTAKELVEAAKASDGAAPSGVPVPVRHDCPTCNGAGTIEDAENAEGKKCVDCGGSGRDGTVNTGQVEDSNKEARDTKGEFSVAHADEGKITVGDSRETIDKSELDLYDEDDTDLEKAKLKTKARNALPDSDFALPGRRYPIHDANHARNALARVAQRGTPEEKSKVRAAVRRRYPDIDVGGAEKSEDVAVKDGMVSGPNPFLNGSVSGMDDGDDDDAIADGPGPGSPEWEAVDAATATAAAVALMEASELIRTFAQREEIEVAAGEGNDIFDSFAATEALCGVSHALGIMAQMAFHEGLEAAKSIDESVVEKRGKRLSTKSVSALAAARDHLSELLGDDDPAKQESDDNADATKSIDQEVIEVQLTTEEFDSRVASAVVKALTEVDEAKAEKGKAAMDEADAVSGAKNANRKAKNKSPEAEDEDLEDEADQGDHASANTSPKGAAKAEAEADVEIEVEKPELTAEEIEAKKARKAAKKALREAEEAEKQAAENAALTKKIEEHLAKVVEQNEVLKATVEGLQTELQEVQKRAAPNTISRMAPPEATTQSNERTRVEREAARLESLSKTATTREMQLAYAERAREERAKLAALGN